jgi:UDP-N-acetylglucosamine 4,6-dehydratase
MFKDKTVLITGGTGSFGQACARALLTRCAPRKVIIFSRDELKQYQMGLALPEAQFPAIRFFIGDVRDKERLMRAFRGVDYVIHAAALKQVPAAEYNPLEAIKTNIMGAANIIDAAIDCGVSRVIALSTDKAVNPVNLYGATKLCSDKLFVAANSYVGEAGTRFSVVRYGNVLGSRGSVVQLFREQRKTGRVTITDARMTRFWITLARSVDFVLESIADMVGGEIFVPKLPSMRVVDLAEACAPGCAQDHVGIRPGEKLHELMIPRDEARNTVDCGQRYIIKPVFPFFYGRFNAEGCQPVPEDFEYSSATNTQWLSVADLRRIVDEH